MKEYDASAIFGDGKKTYDASDDFEAVSQPSAREHNRDTEGLISQSRAIKTVTPSSKRNLFGNNNNAAGAAPRQSGDTLVPLEDLDAAPISFQGGARESRVRNLGPEIQENFEVSLIENIMQYTTMTPPISVKGVLVRGPENWSKFVKVPLNILKLGMNIGVPVGASVLYASGAVQFANGDFAWAVLYTTCSVGSNFLQNALFVQETFASFKSEHERALIGDERPVWRSNLPLIGYITTSTIPAASSTLSFLATNNSSNPSYGPLALLTQVANMFMYTFAERDLVLGINASLVRRWHEKAFPFKCLTQTQHNKDMVANYLLKDRLIAVLEGVQANIIRNRDRQNFPANLMALTTEHNYDPLNATQRRIFIMGILIAKAKISGVIDIIGHPDHAHSRRVNNRVNTFSSIFGLTGSVLVASSLLGFLVANETGIDKIASEITWLAWLATPVIKYSLSAAIDAILVYFLSRAGHNVMTRIAKTTINACRGKLELPWVMQMHPLTTIGFVLIPGVFFASFSYGTAVLLIQKIPENHHLLGFLPNPLWLQEACKKLAYVGIPLANGYFNLSVLTKILESLVTRINYSTSAKLYARLARAIDQAIEDIKLMDTHGTFGNEFAKLINITTDTAHFGVVGRNATTVFHDVTAGMNRPEMLVHRASGARRAATDERVPLRDRRLAGTMFGGERINADEMEEEAPRPARDRCCTIL